MRVETIEMIKRDKVLAGVEAVERCGDKYSAERLVTEMLRDVPVEFSLLAYEAKRMSDLYFSLVQKEGSEEAAENARNQMIRAQDAMVKMSGPPLFDYPDPSPGATLDAGESSRRSRLL